MLAFDADKYVCAGAATLALASVTAREFYKVDAFAGKILIPYLAWLAFANALNYSIWKKNPGVCNMSNYCHALHQGTFQRN